MRKIINKNLILGFILGIIVSGGIVCASGLFAEDIVYNSTNPNFKATNVKDALNQLYNLSKDYNNPDYSTYSIDGITLNDDYSLCFISVARLKANNLKLNSIDITPNISYYYSTGGVYIMSHVFSNLKQGDIIEYTSLGSLQCWK